MQNNDFFYYTHFDRFIITLVTLAVFLLLRFIINKITKKYAEKAHLSEHRAHLVSKYIDIFMFILLTVIMFAIWGVNTKDLFVVMSSVFAVIGVALFAQWSILSNITSGIILFFSFPFRIGDFIKIHDKDFPIEAQIEDIKAFHTLLRTKEGELITYPNNLLLQKGITVVAEENEQKEFYD
ncbi:mechanosensitive ion channel domain-containing protein [Flavobacterium coralii]|uniref:mechanosensitive ion channel domain-containing protein n=1 Tax=Flavobacterium coralii TaxID=2838017 RepID=UPI000C438E88|nr:mechanosensitive ion channel protein MscS [Flavobacterium sp.]|tara:strand:+ start:29270 stop:29812 length:543 start_codon:yes stop_codon:yes gene_type:complete